MKKTTMFAILIAGMLVVSGVAMAQSANGTLTVSATVQTSINMVFISDGSGVPLGSSGTNAATLNFGNISAYGALSPNVGRSVTATDFTVSTPFDVLVNANGSPNYTLAAALNAADAVNSWYLDATQLSTTAATLTATGGYGANAPYTLGLKVPLSSAAGAISNTINFTATAN
jgi:hypothetical protein